MEESCTEHGREWGSSLNFELSFHVLHHLCMILVLLPIWKLDSSAHCLNKAWNQEALVLLPLKGEGFGHNFKILLLEVQSLWRLHNRGVLSDTALPVLEVIHYSTSRHDHKHFWVVAIVAAPNIKVIFSPNRFQSVSRETLCIKSVGEYLLYMTQQPVYSLSILQALRFKPHILETATHSISLLTEQMKFNHCTTEKVAFALRKYNLLLVLSIISNLKPSCIFKRK